MGQRMFVAIKPSEEAVADLAAFLEPRSQHPWIDPRQWHLTLAFLPSVPEHREEELAEALAERLLRLAPLRLRLAGAGAFPDPFHATVLWMDVRGDLDGLAATAQAVRRTSNHVGATPDGQAFRPHLTVSRLRRPQQETRWVEVLQTYAGPEWVADEVELIASHLQPGGRGRPRHETVSVAELADREDTDGSTW
ncbi:2'-5' RNA ligase [Barrientosiimonas humi]|uniref:RNA 2',3'-cyclic phosphodiesterase n=1 Tax=Barrientosiimonas humi TaxID=999931 RepID=A0A542XGD7_9MICO|nr:RNA 2',3'-cyclic phosphodiesterase [Barrientosiimonas humi]TQL34886.1 2'-5' RNA ligase [Barrientosiimonas humi]CAG7571082.1 RNA 2',3'-cyclic phosphodiesterase [Barrientosiimonas humi]